MGDYRDDRDALRERARVLEEELAERDRQLAEQRAELDALLSGGDDASETAPVGAERTCPKCGKVNQPHYQFCLGCGDDLDEAAPAPDAAAAASKSWAVAGGVLAALLVGAILAILLAR